MYTYVCWRRPRLHGDSHSLEACVQERRKELWGRQPQLVSSRVFLQVVLAAETLGTHCACVGPQPRVYALVAREFLVAREALAALLAAEGSLSCNSNHAAGKTFSMRLCPPRDSIG
jgi:hypothetical protein